MKRVGEALRVSAFAALLVACGGGPSAKTPEKPARNVAADLKAFEGTEDTVLLDLAALDRRIASRARITPREDDLRRVAMAAVLAEDPSLAVVDGAIDPFSFEARARGLANVRKVFDAAPSELPREAVGTIARPALEHELLGRLVDEETVRLDEERQLPRSASALLRGIIDTWNAPKSSEDAAERDRWLERRLEEVRASVKEGRLDVVRARELDDALDALEHEIDQPGMGKSIAKLVELRDAIEANHAANAAGSEPVDWARTARRLQAHLGFSGPEASAERLAQVLDQAEKKLRDGTTSAFEAAKSSAQAAGDKIAAAVFARTPCVDAVPGSRLRSMAPPPERLAACHLRHVVDDAKDDLAKATALAIMHEHVIVAQWALDVARGETMKATQAKHRPISLPSPETTAHWERVALARPITALGGGLAAAMIVEGDAPKRAHAWSALGEVPLDVAARELAAVR